MSEENKIWSVVEFDDGSIHIVPRNWFFFDKSAKLKCYWPTQGTFKTITAYIKAVKKMASPDENWPVFEAQILSGTDDFDVAYKKLKKAETYTDLTTDAEQDKISRNLRHKKRIISSSSSTDEDNSSQVTLVKLPAVPKPPSSGNNNTSDKDQKKLASVTERLYKKSKSSNKPVSYDYEERFQSPIYCKPPSGHLTNSKNVRRSLIYNSKPSSDYQTDSKIFHPSPSYDEPSSGHSAINSKHSRSSSPHYDEPLCGREANSKLFHPSPSYDELSYSDHPTNSQNACPSSSYNDDITDNISLFQKGKNRERRLSNNDFQDRVLRQLSHIKLHLLKLDEKVSSLNYPSPQNTNIDTYDTNILDNFPLKIELDLQNVEIKLKNDEIYKSNMLTALSKMGGSKTDESTKYILKKIYSDQLAMCYSWMGGKGKKVLSTMLLPKIIIEVVQKRIQNSTEIDIVNSIKNWLRHAYQRNLNSLKAAEKRSVQNKEDDE
eukprot:XP_016659619.1 PREDICTED: uncharacterized protein LOC107883659 [Acyrthosiphon pisum]